MAPRMTAHAPALAHYQQFADALDLFANASCIGCRGGGSNLPFCAARRCHKGQGVDYCFQCDQYPCTWNEYPEDFDKRWRAANDRMREVGVEEYYRESLQEPRYS
jgi:hypothetical protein